MLETLIRFAACCRSWELRVSTQEVLDCARHLSLTSSILKSDFKAILKTNFAKSRREQKKFDQVFDLYFNHDNQVKLPIDTTPEDCFQDDINRIREDFQKDSLEKDLIEFLSGDPSRFLKQVVRLQTMEETKSPMLKSNLAQLSAKLNMMQKISGVQDHIMKQLSQDQAENENYKREREYVEQVFDHARNLITREPGAYNNALMENKASQTGNSSIKQVPFHTLSQTEIHEMKEVMARLVCKLKDQVSRRSVLRNRGTLDVKKTLRYAGKFQGIPLDLKFRNKSRKKSKIIALCDVSGSVWSTARFMLHLLFSLAECFTQVRSFVFVSDLCEVTDFFTGSEVNDALDRAMSQADINYHAPTDYGMAFQTFKGHYLSALDSKTTLIILGDGRSNYQNPQSHILSELREKSRRIIWLNPEPYATWFTGDSEMQTYRKHCHEVSTCMNLSQLENVIRNLVL